MPTAPDAIAQAQQMIGLAVLGLLVYALLDVLVLRRNESFRRGALWFRLGVLLLVVGVGISAAGFIAFDRGAAAASIRWLWASYALRALGLVLLLVGVARMRKSA